MAESPETSRVEEELADISLAVAENRGWFIALGVLLIILGVIAIAAPHVTGIAVKILLGWLFLIGGIAEILHAFSTSSWRGFVGNLLIGLLYAVTGFWLAFYTTSGLLALTVFLAAMFAAEGVFKFVIALQVRPQDGWFWLLISGIVSLIAGVLLFTGLPYTAVWAVGLIAGINILWTGATFLSMAMMASDSNPASA
ncbi:MAG: HdeD family acid-resistance protein [Hyphomicrobiaceae bacterium]